jgi:Cu+-exporting ATPase
MVEEAQASTANIQRIADKVASYFIPAVISVAFFSAAGWSLYGNYTSALLSFVAVLIIACPCALGIATLAALMVGIITFDLREEDLLLYAATAEKGSEHPLAEAILRKAEMAGLSIPDAEAFEAMRKFIYAQIRSLLRSSVH